MSASAHEGPILIARNASQPPQLVYEGPHGLLTGEECIELLPGDGVFTGLFVEDEPSFDTILADEPDEGLFRMFPGAEIALRRISFDTGFRIFEPVEFREILTDDGGFFVFPRDSNGDFNIHLIGGSDHLGMVSATFQFFDLSGQHADSEPFTICFQTVPAPSSLCLVPVGLLVGRRRRRPRCAWKPASAAPQD